MFESVGRHPHPVGLSGIVHLAPRGVLSETAYLFLGQILRPSRGRWFEAFRRGWDRGDLQIAGGAEVNADSTGRRCSDP